MPFNLVSLFKKHCHTREPAYQYRLGSRADGDGGSDAVGSAALLQRKRSCTPQRTSARRAEDIQDNRTLRLL